MRSSVRLFVAFGALQSGRARTLIFCLSALVFGLCAAPASAQETGGSIAGTISDAQSATLPGVSVSLRNEDTNAQLQTVTNGEGAYVLPFVPIGRYTLTVTLNGFTTTKREGIEVRVGDRLRLDLSMQLGAAHRRSDRALGGAAPRHRQRQSRPGDQPRAGRRPAAARPQSRSCSRSCRRACSTRRRTASRSNRPFDNGGMDNFQISGGRGFTNEFLLDGVPNTGTETNQPNNLSFVPSPDATAEFKVQTSIYDAQYGRTGGGVVNVVLKSGTNQFHGAVYEYYRDEKLNANTFDANRAGNAKPGLYWSQPGLTVDGPVKIPGLYNGTDKTFFMYNWEQIRSEVPFPQVYTVPSALERTGDFSQSRTADGRPITIYDPLTTRLENGQNIRDPFPGNVIPANRIDPVALQLLQRVPMPNATGLVNNFLVPENARADRYDQHVVKVDQVINGNHRFFARYARNKRTEVNDYAGFPPEASPWYQHGRMNVGFAVEGTSVLSPSLVLSSRAGFIRHDFYIATHGDNFDPGTLGFPSSFTSQLAAPDVPADPVGRLQHLREHVRRQQRQHLHRQRHVVVVRGAQQDHRQPLVQVRRRDARAGQQPAEPDLVDGALHLQPRVHPAQRAGGLRRCGELGRVAAARLPGRRVDDDGAERVADLPAAPLRREILRPVRAGRLAGQLAADA